MGTKNTVKVDHKELKQTIEHLYDARLPLFVWGTFGIGKTYAFAEVSKAIAARKELRYTEDIHEASKETFVFKSILLHEFDPAEVGLPVPNMERKVLEFFGSDMFPKEGQGIILLDEINLAPALTQANFYQLIREGIIGKINYKLPEGFVCFAAGNTIEDRAHTSEMAMPLKNRFGHVELLCPTAASWAREFAIPNGLDLRITNFLQWREEYIHKYDSDMMEEVYAIPTPRTWEYASKAIKGIDDLNLVARYAGSYISDTIGKELADFCKMINSYDIEKIYQDKKLLNIKGVEVKAPQEPDQKFALIAGLISYYQKQLKKDKIEITKEYTNTLCELIKLFDKESAIMMLYQVMDTNKKFWEILEPAMRKDITKNYLHILL